MRGGCLFGLSTRGSYRPLDTAKFPERGRAANFENAYTRLVQACTRLVASGRVRAVEDPEVIAPQPSRCIVYASAARARLAERDMTGAMSAGPNFNTRTALLGHWAPGKRHAPPATGAKIAVYLGFNGGRGRYRTADRWCVNP